MNKLWFDFDLWCKIISWKRLQQVAVLWFDFDLWCKIIVSFVRPYYAKIWIGLHCKKNREKLSFPVIFFVFFYLQPILFSVFHVRHQNNWSCWGAFSFFCGLLPINVKISPNCLSVNFKMLTVPSLGSHFFIRFSWTSHDSLLPQNLL